eukprot:3940381-Rhodomonas_salina.1
MAVLPPRVRSFAVAPHSRSRNQTTSQWHCRAASMSGVMPCASLELGSVLLSSTRLATSSARPGSGRVSAPNIT